MKLLFLDSNIFLNFYDFHDEDLEQLGKLVDLIKVGEVKLFLTTQVCNEIKKNRENRLKIAYGDFVNMKHEIRMPVFTKHYSEHAEIKKAQNIISKLKSRLSKKLEQDIHDNKLKADIVIKDLISNSILIESDKYLEKAEKRHKLGRPPGKKDRSFGDEINWEALLDGVKDEGHFIIISQDGDYANAVDGSRLKDYLIEEWLETNLSEIFLYKTLTSFFKDHDIKIELRIEDEKNELILNLINSGSFLTTHNIIAQLTNYSSFSDDQIKGMATAIIQNNQVNWLAEDEDVKSFYEKNLLPKVNIFDIDTWNNLRSIICRDTKDEDFFEEINALQEESDKDDIPF